MLCKPLGAHDGERDRCQIGNVAKSKLKYTAHNLGRARFDGSALGGGGGNRGEA